jgi:hypothetical protein
MSVLVDSFFREVTACSPGLWAAHQATIDYWAPDNPPVTVALSELGHRIVDDLNSVDRATNEAIFKTIEDARAKGDAELTRAVATGMIEAIAGRAIRVGVWDGSAAAVRQTVCIARHCLGVTVLKNKPQDLRRRV